MTGRIWSMQWIRQQEK
jgi:hypothetical protein